MSNSGLAFYPQTCFFFFYFDSIYGQNLCVFTVAMYIMGFLYLHSEFVYWGLLFRIYCYFCRKAAGRALLTFPLLLIIPVRFVLQNILFCLLGGCSVFFFPVKKKIAFRENVQFSVRETPEVHMKKSWKVPVKSTLYPWKFSLIPMREKKKRLYVKKIDNSFREDEKVPVKKKAKKTKFFFRFLKREYYCSLMVWAIIRKILISPL